MSASAVCAVPSATRLPLVSSRSKRIANLSTGRSSDASATNQGLVPGRATRVARRLAMTLTAGIDLRLSCLFAGRDALLDLRPNHLADQSLLSGDKTGAHPAKT